jgi:WD40 repeat protein
VLCTASAAAQQSKDWTKPLPAGDTVRCLAYSRDGRRLAAATSARVIVWDTADQSKPLFVQPSNKGFRSVAFSRDNKILAAGNYLGECLLLDATTGAKQAELGGHGRAARAVAFSPDGKTLAVGGEDHDVHLWDYAARKKLRTLVGHTEVLNCLNYSPDGKTLVSCGNEVRLWDAVEGTPLKMWDREGYVADVCFDPKSQWLVIANSSEAALLLRDPRSDTTRVVSAGSNPHWVAIHPMGKVMATTRWEGGISILPLDLREARAEERKTIEGLITAWQDDSFAGREKASAELVKLGWIADPFLAKAVKESPLAETRQRARQARLAIRHPADRAPVLRGHQGEAWTGVFSPDGQVLATAGQDGVVILWDWANGKIKAKLRVVE